MGNWRLMKANIHHRQEATGEPRLLTKNELAAELQVSTRTINEWQRRGYLPFLKIGARVRFQWPQLLTTLERRFGRNFQ